MAPHLTAGERDHIAGAGVERLGSLRWKLPDTPFRFMSTMDQLLEWKGTKTAIEIHALLTMQRRKDKVQPLAVRAVRKALRGATHHHGRVETRGRKRKVTPRGIAALDKARKRLQEKADGEHEVTWQKVIKTARVKAVHRTTASRRMNQAGINVKWRRPREKPQLTAHHKQDRAAACAKLRRLPQTYFANRVDLIIDNKMRPIPTTAEARKHLKRLKVRGHLRTPSEGLKPGYTKPNPKKHRANPGGSVTVCAGIQGDRVVMWAYLPQRWCGQAAVDLYQGAIKSTLRRTRGVKNKYLLLEDNDPTGYKSNAAIDAKKDLGIQTVDFPKYSPDLNPCDYFLWQCIDRRMDSCAPKGRETKTSFMARLRRVALATNRATIRKALAQMKPRIQAVYDAKGAHITMDA